MAHSEKLIIALGYAISSLPSKMAAEIEAMLTPANLAVMTSIMAMSALLAGTGIGAVIIVSALVALFGYNVIRIAELLAQAQSLLSNAKTCDDLKNAGEALAGAMIIAEENVGILFGLKGMKGGKKSGKVKFKWKGPKIRSAVAQTALRDRKVVDQIKCDMLNDEYLFTADRGRIGGYKDSDGTYYIGEGHHRMNAALEIFEETGNTSYVDALLENGLWTPGKPPQSGPLPRK